LNPDLTFQLLVDRHYGALYRFGVSLSGNADAASDLVQQTFFLWAEKGHQLRDQTKSKSWLFTTLYREYLATYRRAVNHPQVELDDTTGELPNVEPDAFSSLDGGAVVAALQRLDEVFRAPLTLFYLQDVSYKEIADILDVPIGTVMSRLSRGKEQLRTLLTEGAVVSDKVVAFEPRKGAAQ
jgi:RNA polymerase sigma factor (sigma-70 family)